MGMLKLIGYLENHSISRKNVSRPFKRNLFDVCTTHAHIRKVMRIFKFSAMIFETYFNTVVLCYLGLDAFYVGLFSEVNLLSVKIIALVENRNGVLR